MQALPPLPSHILLPPEDDIRRIESTLWTPARCIICSGTGTFRWWNPERTEPIDWACSCDDQYVLGLHLLSRGIGLKHMRTGWADLTGVPATGVRWAQDYLDYAHAYASRGVGAVLLGSSGTGKSSLTHLMLRALIAAGFDGYWTTYPKIMSLVKSGYDDPEIRRWFERRIRNAQVLVVDELGKEQGSDQHAASVLDDMLRFRLGAMMPTFLASNLTEEQLQTRYGHAVVEVIREASTVHTLYGQSWRGNEEPRVNDEVRRNLSRPIVLG